MQTEVSNRRKPSPRITAIFIIVAIMGMLVAINVSQNRSTPPISSADQTNAELVAIGRITYQAHCASCHGANLEGQANWAIARPDGSMPAPPHDPTGHTWHHNDRSLFETITYGGQATSPSGRPNTMPAFQGVLSDREIWATLAFIKSTWPAELIERQKNGHE